MLNKEVKSYKSILTELNLYGYLVFDEVCLVITIYGVYFTV